MTFGVGSNGFLWLPAGICPRKSKFIGKNARVMSLRQL